MKPRRSAIRVSAPPECSVSFPFPPPCRLLCVGGQFPPSPSALAPQSCCLMTTLSAIYEDFLSHPPSPFSNFCLLCAFVPSEESLAGSSVPYRVPRNWGADPLRLYIYIRVSPTGLQRFALSSVSLHLSRHPISARRGTKWSQAERAFGVCTRSVRSASDQIAVTISSGSSVLSGIATSVI